jgi:hypothetical protein
MSGPPPKTDLIDCLDKFDVNNIRKIGDYIMTTDLDGTPQQRLDHRKFISDLKRIVVIIDKAEEIYFYKDFDDQGGYHIKSLSEDRIGRKFKGIKLPMKKDDGKVMTLWDYIQQEHVKSQLRMSRVKFSPQKYDGDNTYYMFHGYKYNINRRPHYHRYIKHFLYHVFAVICNKNRELCGYVFDWIASILQEPRFKTEVVLVVKGGHGSGKNTFFTNIICKLLGEYAIENITDMNNILGTFNSIIEYKKLAVCNEAKSSDDPMRKYLDNDRLRTVVTDPTIDINEKNQPQRIADNVLNLIIVSNNDCVNIADGERRLLPFTTNNEYAKPKIADHTEAEYDEIESKREAYFDQLNDEIHGDDFYQTLFTYFMTRDVSKFRARKFPQTQERKDIIEDNKPPYELFIIDMLERFHNGIETQTAYELYNKFCLDRGFKNIGNINTFGKNIKDWIDRTRQSKGSRSYNYKLNALGVKHFQQYILTALNDGLGDAFADDIVEI